MVLKFIKYKKDKNEWEIRAVKITKLNSKRLNYAIESIGNLSPSQKKIIPNTTLIKSTNNKMIASLKAKIKKFKNLE